MSRFPRVTAYRYSLDHALPCDLDSLLVLGLAAARHGRWLGIGECKTWEGPPGAQFPVHTWPDYVFAYVTRPVQVPPPQQPQFYPPGSWAAVMHRPDAGWGEDTVPWDGDDIRPG
jgi:hypothetical protein